MSQEKKINTDKIIKDLIERWKSVSMFRDISNISILIFIFLIFSFSLDIPYHLNHLLSHQHSGWVATFMLLAILITIATVYFAYHRYKETISAVADKIKAEIGQEKSREQLQAVLDGVPDLIVQLDPMLRISWANRTALNYSDDIIGQLCHDAFHYAKGSFIDSYTSWAMDGRQIEEGIQYVTGFLGQKGGAYWEIIGVPLINKKNTVYGAIAIAREITSRMRTEHTWNLLSSVVESTDDAIYGLTLDGTVLSWNAGAEQTYFYRQNEIVGKSIDKVVPVLDRKAFYEIVEKVMRSEHLEKFEAKRIRRDGREIFVSVSICPFFDATGQKVGVSVIEKDITEAKRNQEKLIESENFNRTIISSVKEGIAVYNSKLQIMRWNSTISDITGISEQDVLYKTMAEVFAGDVPDELITRLSDALDGKTIMFQDTFLRTPARRDGGWYNITFSPHINANGEIIGVIATYRDITQSKIAEVALEYSEEKYRQLVENVSEAIANIAVDGTILFVNKVAAKLLNNDANDLVGRKATDILPAKLVASFTKGFNSMLDNNEKRIFDFTMPTADGDRSFLVSTQPVHSEKNETTSIMCLITDITYRKKAEKELEYSREQLRNLAAHLESVRETERKEIAFEVHDELGQELTALKLDLAWVGNKLPDIDPRIKTKISEMKDLIDITIDRVGNISTKLRPDILDHFGLLAAIEWVTGDFQKRSGISCELIFDPEEMDVPGNIATVIFRILQETLTNAIRHSKANTVEVLFRELPDKYELFVTDNGVGISQEQIDAPSSFGLFAMNERARSVGGSVKISGIPDEGTEVYLEIPR